MSENATTTFTPPYIAFKTITTIIERMQREEPPTRIDKSYLDSFSGGYQTQVLAALHSLELVGPGGELSETLKALVRGSESDQQRLIGDLIQRHYAPILALGTNSTQAQLLEAFSQLSPKVTGDTRRKAIAFFLGAAKFAGIPVSRHWKTPRMPPSGRKREAPGRNANPTTAEPGAPEDTSQTSASVAGIPSARRLDLRSGGVVTLGVSVDLFALTSEDRKFVFELIDKMTAYEAQRQLSPPPVSSEPSAEDQDEADKLPDED